MKNIVSALLARFRRQSVPIVSDFTLVSTDLKDEIALHSGDIITSERSFVGFAVEASIIREGKFRVLPLAHCDSLREAEMLVALLNGAIARNDARFNVRSRPRYSNQYKFQGAQS